MSILAATRLRKRAIVALATLAVALPVTVLATPAAPASAGHGTTCYSTGAYWVCYPLPHIEDLPEGQNHDLDISAF
jgi:hypothetical protein